MSKHFPQPWEPNVSFGLTQNEQVDNLSIQVWENEGYIKYKVFDGYFEMRSVYVKKEAREKGVGTKMMEWVEKKAIEFGKPMVKIRTSTDGKTDVLGCFISKLGYKPTDENLIWAKKL